MVIIKKYNLETDMCVELTRWLESSGFDVYPEQDGWDLLAIKGKVKFGVQAKLKPNMKVLTQALSPGPQYRCVAVGNCNNKTIDDFAKLAQALGLIVINMSLAQKWWLSYNKNLWGSGFKLDWYHYRQEEGDVYIPPIKVNHPAGVPSPKTVSQWKIGVCQLERFIRRKGYVNVHDVEKIVATHLPYKNKKYARTLMNDFCRNTGKQDPDYSRCKKFILKPRIRPPSKQFKEIYKALEEQDES